MKELTGAHISLGVVIVILMADLVDSAAASGDTSLLFRAPASPVRGIMTINGIGY
jgi:hypothetical protein